MDIRVDGITHRIDERMLNQLDVGEVLSASHTPLTVTLRTGKVVTLEGDQSYPLGQGDLPLQSVKGTNKGTEVRVASSRHPAVARAKG
jgi:hypothetical protein